MDPDILKHLVQLGTYGPLGIMVILLTWLFIQERKKTSELTAKLLEFAQASVAADGEHTKGWEALGNLYQSSIKSAEINANMINGLAAMKESVERVEEEMRRINEPKRR